MDDAAIEAEVSALDEGCLRQPTEIKRFLVEDRYELTMEHLAARPGSRRIIALSLGAAATVLLVASLANLGPGRSLVHSTGEQEAERIGYRSLGSVTYADFPADSRAFDVEPGAPSISSVDWRGDRTVAVLAALRSHGYTCEPFDAAATEPTGWSCETGEVKGAQVRATLQYREDSLSPYASGDGPETALRLQVRA